jgi:peptide/nickel transport system permease protein
MWRYIAQRLFITIPVVALVGVITFSMLQVAPGNPAAIIGGDEATPEQIAEIEKALGLDRPYLVQLGDFLGRMLKGDFGTSIFSQRPIGELIAPRLQPTLSLGFQVVILSTILGVGMGMLSAWKAGTQVDRGVMVFAVLGFAMPGFWLAILLIWVFAVNLGWFPVIGYSPLSNGVWDHLHSMFLPVIVNSYLGSALVMRITRSAMLEILREDYIRTARAKGLRERVVFFIHVLRPSSIPIVTVVGATVGALATGFVLTETIFAIPGLGQMLVQAITRRDFPIIQALLMVIAVTLVSVNLIVDIIYAYIDPRIRY